MKRLFAIALSVAMSAIALSQAPFTIVRPADGAKVRETVAIRFPKNSIPDRGYVGIYVNGKFLEATVPQVSGDFAVYYLDTKAKKIADGPMTIEAVLFQDMESKTVIQQKSSVKVELGNSSTIKVPGDGLLLRYKFKPGSEFFYKVETRASYATISEAQLKLGGRAAELPLDSDNIRLLYAIDDAFKTQGGRQGLVRVQAFPPRNDKGQQSEYAWMTTEEGRERFHQDDMVSLYMRLTDTGREIFGSLAPYWPMEGTAGKGYDVNLILSAPLPVLPSKRVKPGDVWNAPFQGGKINIDNPYSQSKFTTSILARGELLGVEWMMGIPCAKIRTATGVSTGQPGAAAMKGPDGSMSQGKVELEEISWFALDRGMVVRLERTFTQDLELQREAAPAGGGAAGGGGGGGAGAGPRSQGMGGGGGGSGLGSPDMFNGGNDIMQFEGRPKGGGNRGQNSGPPANMGGGGFQGGKTGGTTAGPKMFMRIKAQQVFILEK